MNISHIYFFNSYIYYIYLITIYIDIFFLLVLKMNCEMNWRKYIEITWNNFKWGKVMNIEIIRNQDAGKIGEIKHISMNFKTSFRNYLNGWRLFEAILKEYSVSYDYSVKGYLDCKTNKREPTFTQEQNVQVIFITF